MNEITAEEAVKQIKENCYFASISEKTKQALDVAIKALEAQRNLTNEELYQSFIDLEAENERLHDALEAQQNRCDSCTHFKEQDGSSCYECVKGMADNFEAQQMDKCKGCYYNDDEAHAECVICDKALEAQPTGAVRLISLDDIMAHFPKANFNGDPIENKKAYPYWKTDITGLISILKSVPVVNPCEDAVSRKRVIILIDEASEMHPYKVVGDSDTYSNYNQGWSDACDWLYANIEGVPSVTPKYTDEEIDKAQAVEQAYVDKMVELAVEEAKRPRGKWINKFGKEQGYDIAGIKTWYIQIMCDKCGFIKTAIEGHTGQYHYCPNCGAEMGGAND